MSRRRGYWTRSHRMAHRQLPTAAIQRLGSATGGIGTGGVCCGVAAVIVLSHRTLLSYVNSVCGRMLTARDGSS